MQGEVPVNRWHNWKSRWNPVYGGLWMPGLEIYSKGNKFEPEYIYMSKVVF